MCTAFNWIKCNSWNWNKFNQIIQQREGICYWNISIDSDWIQTLEQIKLKESIIENIKSNTKCSEKSNLSD